MFTSRGRAFKARLRTFCRTDRRVTLCSEVKDLRSGAEAKASLNRANELHDVDPKPGDLSMARLKWEYNPMEDRTRRLLKKAGMSCG